MEFGTNSIDIKSVGKCNNAKVFLESNTVYKHFFINQEVYACLGSKEACHENKQKKSKNSRNCVDSHQIHL